MTDFPQDMLTESDRYMGNFKCVQPRTVHLVRLLRDSDARFIVGETFPGAEITGVDLSPIQPDMYDARIRPALISMHFADSQSRVPPNVRFFVEDISQEWVSPPNYFDFIHVRCLAGSISDWLAFIEECYR
jgi:hypothetical protein